MTDKEKLRIIENSRKPGFVEKSNPSIVDYPSLVDNFALTKKSTIEGFQCIFFFYQPRAAMPREQIGKKVGKVFQIIGFIQQMNQLGPFTRIFPLSQK